MMNKKLISNLTYTLFLALGIFLVWWQLTKMTPVEKDEFTNTLRSANYTLLLPILFLIFLAHFVRTLRWNLMLDTLGYKPKPLISFAAVMSGYLANTAVPRLGEVVRCATISRNQGYELDKVLGTVIAERVFDLVCYLALIIITFFLQIQFIGSTIKTSVAELFSRPGLINKMLLWTAIIIVTLLLVKILLNRFAHIHLISKIKNAAKGMLAGIKSLWKMERRWLFFFYTIAIWFLYIAQIYLGFKCLPELSHLGFPVAFSILSLATLSMILTPGGLGSFPIFVMQALALYGVHAAVGKAFGWLLWGGNTAFSVVAGLICVLFFAWQNHKKQSGASTQA